MRLRLIFSALISLMLLASAAAASGPQLTAVNVTPSGDTVVVTLRAGGPIDHTEYRPEDQMLMVDLHGVSPAALKQRDKTVGLPALKSYRVLSYIGANGTENTRVEFTLGENVSYKVEPGASSLDVRLTVKPKSATSTVAAPPAASPASAPPVPAAPVKSAPPVTTAKAPAPAKTPAAPPAPAKTSASKPAAPPATTARTTPAPAKTPPVSHAMASTGAGSVRDVIVKSTQNGLEVSIVGATSAKPLVLSGPDRLVVDVPGISHVRRRSIPVSSAEVKEIRVAQYQADPPVTRVVFDLTGKRPYDIMPLDESVVVKIGAAAGSHTTSFAAKPESHPAAESHASKPSKPSTPSAAPVTPRPTEKPLAKPEPAVPQAAAPTQPHETMVAAANPPSPAPLPDYTLVQPKYEKRSPGNQANAAARTLANDEQGAAAAQQAPPAPSTGVLPQSGVHTYTGEPISMNLKDVDLKDFFRLISEISGLNIVLDPSISGKETLVLNDVPWDQALELVLQNHGLDKMLEGNVLRVASVDTLKKEADARALHDQAVAHSVPTQTVTRVLSYAHAQDVLPVVKKFLSDRGDVMSDVRTNALIVRDIPSIIPVVDKIIAQLDRKTQQVEIEARVVAAKRNFMRDLGVQLGFGWGNGPSQVGGSPSNPGTLISPLGASNYYQTGSGTIPLFSNNPAAAITNGLSFLNASKSYRIDAVLSMAESRGLLKVLSRPRIVTQNNVKAMVKQGTRLPIVTQGQLGGPNSVSFVDAFLRLEVTPQITAENTIFLMVDVENTQPDLGQAVQGNPALDTQQATTQVLVSDGATVVIGGVVQTTNSINMTQTPLLGSIPLLGNLFKSKNVNTSTTELMFFITPKIVIY